MDLLKSITEQFPPWFANTKIGQAAMAERTRQAFTERQEIVDELGRFVGERSAMVSAYASAEKPLNETVSALKAKLAAAEAKQHNASRKHAADLHQIKSRIEGCERALRASASTEIDAAARAMQTRYEQERHDVYRTKAVTTDRIDPETRRPMTVGVTNEASVKRLLEAMRTARDAFEHLKLENPSDVAEAIGAVMAPVEAAWQAVYELDAAA